MPPPKKLSDRDSDDEHDDAEDVELLPFSQNSHQSSSRRQDYASTTWLSSNLLRAEAWTQGDARAKRWAALTLRLLWLAVVTPFALLIRLFYFFNGSGPRRSGIQQFCRICFASFFAAFVSIALFAFFTANYSPSYAKFPPQYTALRQTIEASNDPGRANPSDQRVFIAASLYDPDGKILRGAWANSVLRLIDLLGPQNTHLSIYESDSGPEGEQAMAEFGSRIHSPKTLRVSPHVPVDGAPTINLPDGSVGIKRIEYLSRARNIALRPLDSEGQFDKILYLNDIYFDPVEAAQLIFLTNSQPYDQPSKERSNYRAACATDFDNPFKFYDTLATRDLEGYSMGVPIFPFFTFSGGSESRKDVMAQTDAVRVKSCWGGMSAFDARYFQRRRPKELLSSPQAAKESDQDAEMARTREGVVRFRSVPELDREYSECCLIHADLTAAPVIGTLPLRRDADSVSEKQMDTGIFMNPYIRTAYDEWTFDHLWVGRRLERMLAPIQGWINAYAGLPYFNDRQAVQAGESDVRTVWVTKQSSLSVVKGSEEEFKDEDLHAVDGEEQKEETETLQSRADATGHWVRMSISTRPGGFCAAGNLQVKRLDPAPGQSTWATFAVPLEGEMARLNEVLEGA
ncbi:hypothetical protein FH972_025119 [Carpinus fangiana]|uniref:Glycosyltransferase family 69 protein n=1 Tax=Carpinus fangiana TaxID=176857 RepID=A0A5N6L091_9ROSI|nr:hypothetical protein FH972_025119 [Carpinus fangiana]